jgi:hypothetical protein
MSSQLYRGFLHIRAGHQSIHEIPPSIHRSVMGLSFWNPTIDVCCARGAVPSSSWPETNLTTLVPKVSSEGRCRARN